MFWHHWTLFGEAKLNKKNYQHRMGNCLSRILLVSSRHLRVVFTKLLIIIFWSFLRQGRLTLTRLNFKELTHFISKVPHRKYWLYKFCKNIVIGVENTAPDYTAGYKKCKELFEYPHLLLLRDIWWSKF
jgi:hypothetical protein